ncbi:alpha/beta hydrolase [Rhizobium sp. SSA_523]|uniref:alpha/beta hydrolase n=1 Tax=Rhizobium sp. SSA_523 TaxID=2952477 RepID=UPI00209174AE|nr:alpha/beta hydrolase [Rhizobium sp. SSA_523]MCO5732873.1 alpha/beta hydrolase [Rhizobium sp. SSA_523]WKC23510.1 alpha/beta hydrolase [Rhizobium sp. SSA_523]
MLFYRITDWNDAYTNGANIPRGEAWPDAWVEPARALRDRLAVEGRCRIDLSYGDKPRNRFDLFLPDGMPKGLVVFVHGGYWQALDKSYWSHLAQGSLHHGFAVAMPSYTLAPQARIGEIVQEIAAAITDAAGEIDGPIHLTGHSAGGHLVTRMVASQTPLAPAVRERVRTVVSISGVHDLRPLVQTGLNAKLRLNDEEAAAESPVLMRPSDGTRLFCWVGGNERAEFIRQNALMASLWLGLGAETGAYVEPDRHHFNVIDGLADPTHPLTLTLLS